MQSVEDKSSASAIMNFINMGIATGGVLLLACLKSITAQILPIAFLVLLTLAIVITILLRQKIKSI